MYNILNIIRLTILFFIIIFLLNCDGRDKKHITTQESLEETKLLDSFRTELKYIPETYNEVVTDTLLSNGFQVKIKTFTDMNDNILNDIVIDSVNYKYYYRNYVGEINIYYNKSLVLNMKIDKELFKKLSPDFRWEVAMMGQVILDQESSTTDQISLNVFYCLIESETCKDYKLKINNSGDLKIEELEDELELE